MIVIEVKHQELSRQHIAQAHVCCKSQTQYAYLGRIYQELLQLMCCVYCDIVITIALLRCMYVRLQNRKISSLSILCL